MSFDLKKHFISCLVIVLLGLLAYTGTLQTPFLFNDEQTILSPTPANDSEAPWIESIFGQPVLEAAFSMNRAWSGVEAGGYHAVNLAIHLVIGLLFYFLVRHWVLLAPPEQRASLDRLPLFAAAIHIVHPFNTQAVIYIADRSSLLVTLFYLAGLLCILIYRNNQDGQRPRSPVLAWLALSFFLLGCGTSAVAITLPVMAVIYLLTISSNHQKDAPLLVSILSPFIFYILLRLLGLDSPFSILGQVPPSLEERAIYLMIQIKAFAFYYLPNFLWPIDLSFAPHVPKISSLADWQFILSFIIIGLGILVFNITKSAVIRWGLLWLVITHFPASSVTPMDPVVSESRFYLPGLGLSFLLGYGILRAFQKVCATRPVISNIGMTAIIALLFLLTVNRGHDYRSPLTLWQDTVIKSPGSVTARVQLGLLYMQQKEYENALQHFQKAIDRSTLNPEPFYRAGLAHLELQQPQKALERILVALRRQPQSAEYHLAMGWAYQQDGQLIESLKQLQLSRKLDPGNAKIHNRLGKLFWDMKSYYFAEASFQKAYEYAPQSVDTLNNLISANMALQEYGHATHFLKILLELEPDDARASQMLIAAERLLAEQTSLRLEATGQP